MKIEKIKFKSRTKNFYAEAIPDNSGVRFMQYDEYGEECVAMFVDNGEEFFLTSKNRYGMLVRPFKPTIQLLLKDGTEPPLEGENQIEVHTPYNKKMIVRTLEKKIETVVLWLRMRKMINFGQLRWLELRLTVYS